MKKVAIITARGGSKRIPRKNIKDFLGKPILAYSIETALTSQLFDEVMVSTDDEEIAVIASQHGASVPFMRSKEKSDDFAGTVEVLSEVIEKYSSIGKVFEYACCIYPTAPFITANLLHQTFSLLTSSNYDCVFPVTEFSYPIQRALKKDSSGKVSMFEPQYLTKRSQDLEKAYHDAGQFYWFEVATFVQKKQLWTENTGVIVLPNTHVQDIDTIEDWQLAEFKYQWLQTQQTHI